MHHLMSALSLRCLPFPSTAPSSKGLDEQTTTVNLVVRCNKGESSKEDMDQIHPVTWRLPTRDWGDTHT